MANIMITYRCNLHCPYCFANEFVNKSYTDMTYENFMDALAFCIHDGQTDIGLIGGEPTVHPEFDRFLQVLADEPKVRSVILYTNGLLLDRHAEMLSSPDVRKKLKILVNCNSPAEQGEKNYQHLKDNLDLMIGRYGMYPNIKLGVNLHNDGFDYTYMGELLTRYDQYQVRMSLTVPDFSACGKMNSLDVFENRKEYLLKFYRDMDSIGVLAYYDCNRPPRCIWTDEEWGFINWYRNRYSHMASNIADEDTTCHPVIDILPNLQAVRCFGLSEMMKARLSDYPGLSDIKKYYEYTFDSIVSGKPTAERCE